MGKGSVYPGFADIVSSFSSHLLIKSKSYLF